MFFKPIKFDQNVVSPPFETKKTAHEIFDRILTNYKKNYSKFKVNPLENPLKDPWFRRESWRWDPYFSKKNVFMKSFPGLGIACAAFSIYLVYDLLFSENESENNHN